jgi:hypothetical protein
VRIEHEKLGSVPAKVFFTKPISWMKRVNIRNRAGCNTLVYAFWFICVTDKFETLRVVALNHSMKVVYII